MPNQTQPNPPILDEIALLRQFVIMRDDVQRARIQTGNRLAAVTRGSSTVGDFYLKSMQVYYQRYGDMEDKLTSEIKELVISLGDGRLPVLADMQCVKGIGPVLAARLLVEIDWSLATSPSSLWAYCGFAPGKDRLKKGTTRPYNARAKTVCWLIGASFLKSRSPYRAVYDAAVAHYSAAQPDWTPLHRSRAAMRKMIKRFLAHLYVVGRTRHGLPVRRPYVEDRLGHVHIDTPEEYGWPAVLPVYFDDDRPTPTPNTWTEEDDSPVDVQAEAEAELLYELEQLTE